MEEHPGASAHSSNWVAQWLQLQRVPLEQRASPREAALAMQVSELTTVSWQSPLDDGAPHLPSEVQQAPVWAAPGHSMGLHCLLAVMPSVKLAAVLM
jgi:hypothetical protein